MEAQEGVPVQVNKSLVEGGWSTVGYTILQMVMGIILHPCLKALYPLEHNKYGDAKNTLSVVDTFFAALLLLLSRVIFSYRSFASVPWVAVVRQTFFPGACIFLSITLATLANYESYWTFVVLGPVTLIFLVILSHFWQGVTPNSGQLGALCVVFVGSVLVVINVLLGKTGTEPPDGWTVAVVSSLAFHANQAFGCIVVRNACVSLLTNDNVTVLDLTLGKVTWACLLCIPYAWMTEHGKGWSILLNARGTASVYIIASIIITCGFQTATIGVISRLQSIAATLVSEQKLPITTHLALFLSGTSIAKYLHLKWDGSASNLIGVACGVVGAVLFFVASRWGVQKGDLIQPIHTPATNTRPSSPPLNEHNNDV